MKIFRCMIYSIISAQLSNPSSILPSLRVNKENKVLNKQHFVSSLTVGLPISNRISVSFPFRFRHNLQL